MFKQISTPHAVKDVQVLKEKLGAEKAFLFGSVARGQQHELSDVDVIFVLDTNKRFHERLGDVWEAYSGDLPLSPLVYTPEEFSRIRSSPALQEMLRGAVEL